jgi:exo-1,4-beta-D-glucosaminidase
VTLWPGQSQTITESYDASQLRGKDAVVTVDAFNVDRTVVASGNHCGTPAGGEDFGHADGGVPSGTATPGKANTYEALADAAQHVRIDR